MTAALVCDECGRLASERGTDEQGTLDWYQVTAEPAIVAGLGLAELDVTFDDEEELGIVDGEELEVKPLEPDWHFCSRSCLASWALAQADAEPEPT